ncbi:HupE / UreJ protein [Loktanella salsilacus]|uniref:HupE / UreJ protein n=1 Tax=Loktanella salsilacus TaxID=195913 RepID=A0A1I4I5P9_9RHOB|nr:HupE / UreJ protein [Loktanella salsilacus]
MSSFWLKSRVRLAQILSSFALVLLTLVSPARAHEVLPSITDMTQDGSTLVFDMRLNIESFLAGINQADVADTNESAQAASYDELHALPPDALDARFRDFWPDMAQNITVQVGDQALPVTLTNVHVADVVDEDVARLSDIQFTAPLPEGAEAVQIGWIRPYGSLVVRQMGVEDPYDGFLEAGEMSAPIALTGGNAMGALATFINYVPTGFDHIVPLGVDHILFVLGLFFLSSALKPLLWQVSAFTLAHTITLALAALGYVTVPASIVEPLIALSIAYVAVENIFLRRLSPWRPFIIFGFGLLHGLGFASVLAQFGLPEANFVPALIGFNIGVEIGQVCVIGVAYLCVYMAREYSGKGTRSGVAAALYLAAAAAVLAIAVPLSIFAPDLLGDLFPLLAIIAVMLGLSGAAVNVGQYDTYTNMVAMPASVLIALVAVYWVIERVFL